MYLVFIKMDQFTEEEIKELHEAFSIIDKDHDGSISLIELGNLMKRIGKIVTHPELLKMVNAADMNGNSQIEFDEFLLMMAKNKKYQCSDQALTDVFNNFDKKDT